MPRISILSALPIIALWAASAAPAMAAEPKLEGTFTDWSVYSRLEGGDKTCFAVAKPKTKTPSTVKHGDIYFLVSNWRSGVATEQPSLMAGYPLKTTRAPKAKVGATSISMYGQDNEAFIDSSADEKKLVAKMRAGANMTVSAVSTRGTETRYQFSLKGITAALKKAKAACQ
jgi:hypothetical protein